MLDIKFIRENEALVKENLKKRKEPEKIKLLGDVIKKDKEYRLLLQESQNLRHRRNEITEEINRLKKEGKNISEKLNEAKNIPVKIKEIEEIQNLLFGEIKENLMRIPNLIHDSVPYGKDETENKEIKKWGEKPKFNFELKPHGELLENLGGADFKRAAKVSGHGFYFLLGEIALMEQALIRLAIDILLKKKYKLVAPPLMIKRDAYEGVTDLKDFETVMYKTEGEDLHLIATSEHPMAAMYKDEVLEEKDLPIRFVGLSTCFRKEIGSHGIDQRGLFRIHQFNKVEQFIFCKPEDSWKLHEELIGNAEEIFRKLKIPYRVVNICTGDLGIVAAKKYDLEAWMPRENQYKEVVSCSNCTSYQAVRLNIKYKSGNKKEYVHTLNSTAVATSRAIRAIAENYQQKDGSIKIPSVLVPYMNGIKKIERKEEQEEQEEEEKH